LKQIHLVQTHIDVTEAHCLTGLGCINSTFGVTGLQQKGRKLKLR